MTAKIKCLLWRFTKVRSLLKWWPLSPSWPECCRGCEAGRAVQRWCSALLCSWQAGGSGWRWYLYYLFMRCINYCISIGFVYCSWGIFRRALFYQENSYLLPLIIKINTHAVRLPFHYSGREHAAKSKVVIKLWQLLISFSLYFLLFLLSSLFRL